MGWRDEKEEEKEGHRGHCIGAIGRVLSGSGRIDRCGYGWNKRVCIA